VRTANPVFERLVIGFLNDLMVKLVVEVESLPESNE